MTPVFLHHNRGVRALAFTIRQDREIKLVEKAPFNAVVRHRDGRNFLITKGVCATAVQYGRIKLTPYTGRFPLLGLLVKRVLEVVRG
mgnify:CR=1 FL=1